MSFYVGLVHYPVINRKGETIASAITSIDLHDFARLCRTYDIVKCFIITPLKDQHELAKRLLSHWCEGVASVTHPKRAQALETIVLAYSLEDALEEIKNLEKATPQIWATSARVRNHGKTISFEKARKLLADPTFPPVMLIFGTAWGLAEELFERAEYILEPILGKSSYNHLSVRCAAAIIIDRLFSGRDPNEMKRED
ncbi:MAG: RNA methyltransferase [Syntrophobacterales bacterium]|nr:RNA methyltransferase [Syntrophobacterales bacterium]